MEKYIGWRGSGKSYKIAQKAVESARNGERTLIIIPTLTNSKYMAELVNTISHGDYPANLQICTAQTAMDLMLESFNRKYIDDLDGCLQAARFDAYTNGY